MNSTEVERIAAHVRKVAANEGGIRCGVCARAVVGLASVCTQCETPSHTDCWDYNGGCSVFGCKAAPKPPVQLDVSDLKPRPPQTRRAVIVGCLALVMFARVGAGMFATQSRGTGCEFPRAACTGVTRPATASPAVSGNFTVRLGSAPVPGQPDAELAMQVRILVVSTAGAKALELGDGPAPHALTLDAAELAKRVDAEVARGTVRVVAAPRLMASLARDSIIRVGKRLMFTGRADAEREPGSIQVRFRAEKIRENGIDLAVSAGDQPEIKMPAMWNTPVVALRLAKTDPGASAFFERWTLAAEGGLEAVVVLVPASR